jgi:hypothetical protein
MNWHWGQGTGLLIMWSRHQMELGWGTERDLPQPKLDLCQVLHLLLMVDTWLWCGDWQETGKKQSLDASPPLWTSLHLGIWCDSWETGPRKWMMTWHATARSKPTLLVIINKVENGLLLKWAELKLFTLLCVHETAEPQPASHTDSAFPPCNRVSKGKAGSWQISPAVWLTPSKLLLCLTPSSLAYITVRCFRERWRRPYRVIGWASMGQILARRHALWR